MDLLSLPAVMIENILSYLSYDEIAKNRVVCKAFNELSMRMLTRGFLMIERRHALALKSVKAQLPRRESERRFHPLARHCDILTSIETRISMLNMTYSKYIENGLCCFIPGKVIDEIRRVLHIAENMTTPPRAHEVLQELRDISSMAIEHFDDKICPALRVLLQQQSQPQPPRAHVLSPSAIRQEVFSLRRRSILNAKLSLYLATQYKKYHNKMMEYQKVAWRQRVMIRRMLKRQRRQEAHIAELKRRIDECDIRYSELTHTKPAVAASISGVESPAPAAPLRHFSSQIKLDLSVLPIGTSKMGPSLLPNMKPRKPVIRMPSISEDDPAAAAAPAPSPSPADPTTPAPAPSTSQDRAAPKTKAQSTLAKIRGITNEIRHLTNLSRNIEGNMRNIEGKLKRPYCTLEELEEVKKMKLD